MSKITAITRTNATPLCNEILDVLNKHFAGRNMRFTRGSGSYNADSVTVKVTGTLEVTTTGAAALAPEEKDYKQLALFNTLPALGTSFVYDGKQYTIVGGSTRSRRFPIICKSPNSSSRIKFTISMVQNLCKVAVAS